MTGLPIHHVVNVDFLGFVRAVDAIDCVWVDVDRGYFHSNVGRSAVRAVLRDHVPSGYQRLCGKDALAYVRYRHTDTDLVRSSRQQNFLSDARERVPVSKLLNDYPQLIKIFTSYTTSDISSGSTFLQVIKLFFDARDAAIKEIHFPVVLGPSYVYSAPKAIHEAVDKFLGFEASGGPRGRRSRSRPRRRRGRATTARSPSSSRRRARRRSRSRRRPRPPDGRPRRCRRLQQGRWRERIARKVVHDFTVYYPRRLPSEAIYAQLAADLPPARHRRKASRRLPDRRSSFPTCSATTSVSRGSSAGATRRCSRTRA